MPTVSVARWYCDGTATLTGTPKAARTYTLAITATNDTGTADQTFTLTVGAAKGPGLAYLGAFGLLFLLGVEGPSVLADIAEERPGRRDTEDE